MDLKEYLAIIKKYQKTFLIITALVIVVAFAYFTWQPIAYNVSLTLNITRSGAQNSADYQYDDFYRLQADEKFAETIVEWLKSPRLAADIFDQAGISTSQFSVRKLSKLLKPEKMSSQIVTVSYSAPNPEIAKKIADSITAHVSKSTNQLNIDQKEISWFKVVAYDPIIILNKISPLIIFLASLAIGLFLAFWAVLIIHYLE
ncbi:MAG: Wzz/FepE/Etk N-terminal domain-containing protein [Candidatus Moranbacteria bacterium]|nr:Wzz/FepE/Etk N-terminal domain-containing protein [Candidatus Moranbacteria bacterium]